MMTQHSLWEDRLKVIDSRSRELPPWPADLRKVLENGVVKAAQTCGYSSSKRPRFAGRCPKNALNSISSLNLFENCARRSLTRVVHDPFRENAQFLRRQKQCTFINGRGFDVGNPNASDL